MGRRKEPPETRNRKILHISELIDKRQSYNTICAQVKVGKDFIRQVSDVMKENNLNAEKLKVLSDEELTALFHVEEQEKNASSKESIYEEPDYEYLEKELMKPGVTKQLLWEEYRDLCIRKGTIHYQITQFKQKLNEHIKTQPYAALIIHKPGELMEVDWTGDQAKWTDPDTGEKVSGWLFVGVLSFSGLTYAEVFSDMKEPSWIRAHVNMFKYFHGITPTLRCDNLKTGIVKHQRYGEYVVQEDYKGLAAYYGIVVVPGEPAAPKSKPLAENTVKYCEQRILAALRNETFYSIEEYNRKLAEKLEEFNNKPFQKKPGSRRRIYEEYEKETLCQLPIKDYEYCEQAYVKVQPDSFIAFDKNFYSVPEKRPGESVSVFAYYDRIEIYDGLNLLTTHRRAKKGSWKKVYDPAHFRNTAKGEWNKDRFLRWAEKIGPSTYAVVTEIFKNGPEQVYYGSVHSLLKLTDKYQRERVENACALALRKVSRPSYRQIKALLYNGQDLIEKNQRISTEKKTHRKEYSYLGETNDK